MIATDFVKAEKSPKIATRIWSAQLTKMTVVAVPSPVREERERESQYSIRFYEKVYPSHANEHERCDMRTKKKTLTGIVGIPFLVR